jgi:hypothetical protein
MPGGPHHSRSEHGDEDTISAPELEIKPRFLGRLASSLGHLTLSIIHTTQIVHTNMESWGRAIAQAVSRRLPTAAARVQTWVWSCGIM